MGIPSIFGLIVAGVIIGSHGTGIIQNNESISIFASVGLLYLMFLAGLEINMNSLLQNRHKSIFFGAATFFIPLIIGFVILRYCLDFSFLPALLVASMFSTHTLLSYPIASRLNITRRESVVVTIGGTIITDTAVLLLLTIITTAFAGKLTGLFWLQLVTLFVIYVFLVLWGLPKIARWFFNNVQSDSTQQFVFVLVALFLSAILARLAGIEPIVGAFLSGLALNRAIPQHSPLMNRTVFIGNALFIPFFLISVGMLVDLKLLLSGFDTLLLTVILISIAISGKFLAALLTQKFFRYSRADRNLIFGLSNSHAAATIAVITIGFSMHILDEKVLNGTTLLILATCMVSSFVTEHAGRRIAVEEADTSDDLDLETDRILVPVSNPESIRELVDFATLTRMSGTNSSIYPLSVVNDDEDVQLSIINSQKAMEQLLVHAAATDIVVTPITRVDINIPAGISRAVKEMLINKVVMGWSGRSATINYFFGNIIDNLLENTQQMVMVAKLNEPFDRLHNIFVLVPANADREIGFTGWIRSLMGLSKHTGGTVKFVADLATIEILRNRLSEYKIFHGDHYIPFENYPSLSDIPMEITKTDLLVAISARPSTISYNRRLLSIPKLMMQLAAEHNFVIIYPEQVEIPER
jgi:Kef-type K+ transport system membrane component KefB